MLLEGCFYVSDDGVRDSLPEGKLTHELTERTIWHYFVENIEEPIPNESLFASVNEQLLHCYRGIRETLSKFKSELSVGVGDELTWIIGELDPPDLLLYLGLKHPGPFFGVERDSVVRSFQGEQLFFLWGRPDECHHVFKMRPPSVTRATLFALEALCGIVHFVDEPAEDAPPAIEVAATIPVVQSPDGTANSALLNGSAAAAKESSRKKPGTGVELLKAHLLQHHQYKCGIRPDIDNLTAVARSTELAQLHDIAVGTVSSFFKRWFKSRKRYDDACERKDRGIIAFALQLMNGDVTPPELRHSLKEEARSLAESDE